MVNIFITAAIFFFILEFYYIVLKDLKKYWNSQKKYSYGIMQEYDGIRLVSQLFVGLFNFKEFLKHYYRTQNMIYVAFMLEIFCFNIRNVVFFIIGILFLLVTIVAKFIYLKVGIIMSVLFMLIFLLISVYLSFYHRNEESIDKNDEKFIRYLKEHNDEKTLDVLRNKSLSIDKANILINRFYENGDANYLAYAIQSFVINAYFYVLIIGVIAIVAFLVLFSFILK